MSGVSNTTSPKRRLSIFTFGNKKSSSSNVNATNSAKTGNSGANESHDPHSTKKDPNSTEDVQLLSPNSPLSLTDENLKNLDDINTLPPPSLAPQQHNQRKNSNSVTSSSTTSQNQHQHQSQQPRAHSDTMSESSLIFERYVQDPFPVMTDEHHPLQQQQNPLQQQQQQHQQQFRDQYQDPSAPSSPHPARQNSAFISTLPAHLATENFIPAAIDSTATLIQSNTDLDEIDMIYSPRRSSVANLSSAFNYQSPQQQQAQQHSTSVSRRSSLAANGGFNKSPSLERSVSMLNNSSMAQQQQGPQQKQPPFLRERKSTISFLSYADMIQNEEQDQNIPRRPSISQTLSSSFLANPSNAGSFQRPRTDSLSSRTPLRPQAMFTHSPSISRQTSARNSLLQKLNTVHAQQSTSNNNLASGQQPQQKFQLAPDSPTSESSDTDDLMLKKTNSSKSRQLSTTSSHASNTNALGLGFTPSSHHAPSALSSNLNENAPPASSSISQHTIDDVLEADEIQRELSHEIVVSSVGDTLRQYKQDIRSA